MTLSSQELSAQQQSDAALDLADVTGKRIIHTRLFTAVTIRAENAAAALEVMARFAVDPRWLIYLPPTMSPSETSEEEGFLEHPRQALHYFHKLGMTTAVCEEKHMGSRAVIVVCRDGAVARQRFGTGGDKQGAIYTRTGRAFFPDASVEREVLQRTANACAAAGLFDTLNSQWLCLDAEIMPWSAKAQALIEQQYGPVAASARTGLSAAIAAVEATAARGVDTGGLAGRLTGQLASSERFAAAVRQYCWPVTGIDGIRIAPFHLLASEAAVHHDKTHVWHMETLAALESHDPLFQATRTMRVELDHPASVDAAIAWWLDLTGRGGEGMVAKPLDFIARCSKGILQPAIKCRGRDYLRIIYGPGYDAPENLVRLRRRGLAGKRSLAIREFALGIEGLERFVAREPLRRVHECAFGVLAMESEAVDPRL